MSRPVPDGWSELVPGVPWPNGRYDVGDPAAPLRTFIRPQGSADADRVVVLHGPEIGEAIDGTVTVAVRADGIVDNDNKHVFLAVAAITPTSNRWAGRSHVITGILDGLRVWQPEEAAAAAAEAEWVWLPAHGPGPDIAFGDRYDRAGLPSVRPAMFITCHTTT